MSDYKIVTAVAGSQILGVNRHAGDGEEVHSYPASQCGLVMEHPDWYLWVGGVLAKKEQSDIDAIEAAKAAEREAREQRIEDINDARTIAALKEVTISQAETWIDTQLDAATDLASFREACRTILKRIIPYLLG